MGENVTTLALGSQPRQVLAKVLAKSEAQESDFMFLGVWENVRDWTHTLPSGLPLWELESRWTLESLEGNFTSQNSLDWKITYVIGKILSKMGLHDPFGYLKHKLLPKKGPRVYNPYMEEH